MSKKVCLCNSLQTSFTLCRLFGLFPLSWKHSKVKETCCFRVSKLWIVYSLIMAVVCVVQAIQTSDSLTDPEIQAVLPIFLNSMTETLYAVFSISLIICHMVRASRMTASLNKIAPLINSGLMCGSASKMLIRQQYIFTSLISLYLCIQYITLFMLNLSDQYETDWGYDRFVVRFVSNIPLMFYFEFCTLSALYIAFFGCFERMVIKMLHFKPVHPLAHVNETNNKMRLFGFIRYNICSEDHNMEVNDDRPGVIIEKLRCLHEDICISIRETNDAMNPQLLVMMAMELAVLVIHWYSVIIYLKYNNITNLTETINFFNWIFICTHSMGIFVFLRSGDQVMSLFNGLIDFLLEYSTRHLTLAEHQQIRIFINKLRFSPVKLNASGVVNISLSLTAPIYGNVLTYVLVALQFKAPEE